MTTTTDQPGDVTASPNPGGSPSSDGPVSSSGTELTALETSHGRTTIADIVVAKIAGIAAREVDGVHALGGGAARLAGQLRERIPGGRQDLTQGVAVEVGERQAAADIDIVADYGVGIADLAEGIRQNVIGAIERMTGLEVTEVNITVHDVYFDEGDDDGGTTSGALRVQ